MGNLLVLASSLDCQSTSLFPIMDFVLHALMAFPCRYVPIILSPSRHLPFIWGTIIIIIGNSEVGNRPRPPVTLRPKFAIRNDLLKGNTKTTSPFPSFFVNFMWSGLEAV